MEVLDPTPPRQDITVRFTADEFEKVADLFFRCAYAAAPLTKQVLAAAREAGLRHTNMARHASAADDFADRGVSIAVK